MLMLSEQELKNIREQLMAQIESMPEPKKSELKSQISSMNDQELEQFLIQNKMIPQEGEEKGEEKKQECVFCSIIQGKIPGYKIDENKSSLALLEINPLSKGHSIVLSKTHNKLPSSAFSLANKLGKRIKSKLKAQEIKIENSQIMGHQAIQVIPIYKDEKLEKKKADEKELILLQDKLKAKLKKKKQKKQEITEIKLERAPARVP